jgi:hypothetical protein
MSPVGSPHVCGRRRRPPTSYYGGGRPDLAPASEVFWPIENYIYLSAAVSCPWLGSPLSPLGATTESDADGAKLAGV